MSVVVARSTSISGGFSSMSSTSAMNPWVFFPPAPSVHGGAGGFGTRVSAPLHRSVSSSSTNWFDHSHREPSVVGCEKLTMQILNNRLASYLEEVRSLHSANTKLDSQIRHFYQSRSPAVSREYSHYFSTISDLRSQIFGTISDNQRLLVQIDNAQAAVEEFKFKYETELNLCNFVTDDMFHLRKFRDGLTFTITDLENQVERLMEELESKRRNHEEEMRELSGQHDAKVFPGEMRESIDLQQVMDDMRVQYELIMLQNSKEVEQWFQAQVALLQRDIDNRTIEVNTFASELSELKRDEQSLEIVCQSAHAEVRLLQQSLEEVNNRHTFQLGQLQVNLSGLEMELLQVRASVEGQLTEHNILLDVKMRLELEIAEYKRLLEAEHAKYKRLEGEEQWNRGGAFMIINRAEETKRVGEVVDLPHGKTQVVTIIKTVVDGEVVSSERSTKVVAME